MSDGEATIEGFWNAIAAKDHERATAYLADDFIERWPQSGEIIRGPSNWFGMVSSHPSFPSTTVERTEGAGDLWVTHAVFEYPHDGGADRYFVCAAQRVRDGKIAEITEYFAAPFEPAEWRVPFVDTGRERSEG